MTLIAEVVLFSCKDEQETKEPATNDANRKHRTNNRITFNKFRRESRARAIAVNVEIECWDGKWVVTNGTSLHRWADESFGTFESREAAMAARIARMEGEAK